ncbi:MAG: hypothetical protein A2X56_12575 [Nitrospirae bacterium GWC2_57_13]|nr:MAG: hypothetical protein A2X56_12575 [Nitrospirae bacterium GWC2_57_13]
MRKLILIGLLMFFAVYSSPTAFASDVNVDPNVETVSSGPFLWESDGTGVRFRVITVLSEVYLEAFVQKIEYGEEGCCAKITKTYKIEVEKSEGFDVSNVEWLGFDSFTFKTEATVYVINKLDAKYEVVKQAVKKR